MTTYSESARELADQLVADPLVGPHVDSTLASPAPHSPQQGARLVILGQDPTVKHAASRPQISMVLNLNKPGSLLRYIGSICEQLGLDLHRDVYATNLVNAFFRCPSATLDPAVLRRAAEIWRPLLKKELAAHPHAPVLTLGQPLLDVILTGDAAREVKHYWGYEPGSRIGDPARFALVPPDANILGRVVFPFPHQPSLAKRFYRETLAAYLEFVAENTGRH